MKITTKINKEAWKARFKAAKKFGCKVMQVSWKICLDIASKIIFKAKKIYKIVRSNPKYRHPVYGIGEVTPLCIMAMKHTRHKDRMFLDFNGKLTEVSRFMVREI